MIYQDYPYIVLEEILGLPLYRASRDINTTRIHGFKRYQHYPYIGLEEISRLALCRA